MKPVLTASDLKIKFHGEDSDTLKGVSLSVMQGELVAIVGESGSGKTLLCRTLVGLPPQNAVVSGDISASGTVSMVLQDPSTSLDPAMPIGKQIREAAADKSKESGVALLALVGIPDPEKAQHEYPMHFSGGMRQRVAIAIALSMRPQIILADEPTSSLDSELSESIMDIFVRIKEEQGTGVLLITHDMQLAVRYADRIIVMEKGKIVEQGNAKEIFERPRQAYTKQLVFYATLTAHHHAGKVRTSPPPLITVKEIKKNYRSAGRVKPVLQNISFSVFPGEALGLYGRSGVGKSTLLRQLCQMEKPDGGAVLYSETLSERCDVQMIFQDSRSALNPRMQIKRLLGEALFLKTGKRPDMNEIKNLLERVELPALYLGRYPHEISGGERQRVAIARAIAMSPKLICADEPVSSLDTVVRTKIVHLLRKIKDEENLTLVFVSHDLLLLSHICDRILKLDEKGIQIKQ